MIEQTQGKMFLAAERAHTETDWFRSHNTFNFGNYHHEHKSPFGNLFVLNDDTLAGGKHFSLLVEEDALIMLIPTVGAVVYSDSLGNEALLEAGQAQVFATPAGTSFLVGNAYDEELINFIQLWIRHPAGTGSAPILSALDLNGHRNQLLEIATGSADHTCFIGKFMGREEVVHKITRRGNGLFVFVLEGAFEVQHRLLETRDGLALWNLDEAALEALSNEAIILLLEIPL